MAWPEQHLYPQLLVTARTRGSQSALLIDDISWTLEYCGLVPAPNLTTSQPLTAVLACSQELTSVTQELRPQRQLVALAGGAGMPSAPDGNRQHAGSLTGASHAEEVGPARRDTERSVVVARAWGVCGICTLGRQIRAAMLMPTRRRTPRRRPRLRPGPSCHMRRRPADRQGGG